MYPNSYFTGGERSGVMGPTMRRRSRWSNGNGVLDILQNLNLAIAIIIGIGRFAVAPQCT